MGPLKHRRQNGVPDIPTTLAGVSGESTVATATPTDSALQVDPSAATIATGDAPAIAGTPTLTTTPTATSSASASATTSPAPSQSSNSDISLGSVIGACVGVVVAVTLIVLTAWWFYRRYTRKLNLKAIAASEKRAARAKENERLKKQGPDTWTKMEEVAGEAKVQANVMPSPNGLEQMTMFQKSPTVVSPTSDRMTSEGTPTRPDEPFSRYHPMPPKPVPVSPPMSQRHLLGRNGVDASPPISWGEDSAGPDPFMSLHSLDTATPLSMAIPTPPAVEHDHRWESAEVLQFDPAPKPERGKGDDKKDAASVVGSARSRKSSRAANPFAADAEVPKGAANNPFIHVQDFGPSSAPTPLPPTPLSLKAQGKQRALDPFIDDPASPTASVPPAPFFAQHAPSESTASYGSDRALQTLIDALDVSEEEVQERLRITSMQPSFMTTTASDVTPPSSP